LKASATKYMELDAKVFKMISTVNITKKIESN